MIYYRRNGQFSTPVIRPTCSPAVSAVDSVIRLSFGKLLVNLLQVVRRTTAPTISLTLTPVGVSMRERYGRTDGRPMLQMLGRKHVFVTWTLSRHYQVTVKPTSTTSDWSFPIIFSQYLASSHAHTTSFQPSIYSCHM